MGLGSRKMCETFRFSEYIVKILILELNQLKNQQFMAFYSSLQFVINLSDISTRTVTLL